MQQIYTVTPYKCIACGKCELACAFAHGKDGQAGESRIKIYRKGVESGTPIVCFQCAEAACVQACPVQALVRNPDTGAVEVLSAKCIRCKMCVAACPFGNMRWAEQEENVHKCDLCHGKPQCVAFCPTKALNYAGR